ncbi:MAG TPA: conserved phage C-terminal domain-containing protein [Methanosarcina sp.]|nr:conserved phage C-terminal domain-containing protein [Methanosarcina sp.]
MNHSFTDEQLLNLINNTIRTKTEYNVEDFTGGSVQITSTNNHQLMKYKVSIFFGYKQKNPIARTIDINESLVAIWMDALLLKCKAMQVSNNGMDYSELNSLMNNLSNEVVSNKVDSNKVISISSGITTTLTTSSNTDSIPYKEVIDYLNNALGSKYQHSTEATRKHIRARFNEGFTLHDFYTVIDKKVLLWKNDPKMQGYLRPETLFGTKFESYLNEFVGKGKAMAAQGMVSDKTAQGFDALEEWGNQ